MSVRDLARVAEQLGKVVNTTTTTATPTTGGGSSGVVNWKTVVSTLLSIDGVVRESRWQSFYATFGPISTMKSKVQPMIKGGIS
jgi:hypothetical protein